MICPHCGQEHPDNYKFCPFTNKQIMNKVYCANEKCSEYGKPLFLDGAICCPICGGALSRENIKSIDSSVSHQHTNMSDSVSNNEQLTIESSEKTAFSNKRDHKLQHSYDEIYEFYDGLARVQRNSMYGFINVSGEEVIPCKYEYLSIFFSNEYCEVTKGGLSGLIDKTGQIVIPCKYDAVHFDEDIDAFFIRKNTKSGIIDKDGATILVPCNWDQISWYENGKAIARKNGLLMVINKYGETLINLSDIYYDVDFGLNDGIVSVKDERGKWGLLDVNENKLVTDFMYDSIKLTESGFIVEMNGNYGLYHAQSSTLLIPCRYKRIWPNCRASFVQRPDGYWSIYNYDLKKCLQGAYKDFYRIDNDYISVYDEDGYCGLIDWDGNIIIRPKKYKIMHVPQDGLIYVCYHDDKLASYYDYDDDFDPDDYDYCGLLDITGKEIIPCMYENLSIPKNGLVVAKFKGNYCVINTNNDMVFANTVNIKEWEEEKFYHCDDE